MQLINEVKKVKRRLERDKKPGRILMWQILKYSKSERINIKLTKCRIF